MDIALTDEEYQRQKELNHNHPPNTSRDDWKATTKGLKPGDIKPYRQGKSSYFSRTYGVHSISQERLENIKDLVGPGFPEMQILFDDDEILCNTGVMLTTSGVLGITTTRLKAMHTSMVSSLTQKKNGPLHRAVQEHASTKFQGIQPPPVLVGEQKKQTEDTTYLEQVGPFDNSGGGGGDGAVTGLLLPMHNEPKLKYLNDTMKLLGKATESSPLYTTELTTGITNLFVTLSGQVTKLPYNTKGRHSMALGYHLDTVVENNQGGGGFAISIPFTMNNNGDLVDSIILVRPDKNQTEYAIVVPPGQAYLAMTSFLPHAVLRTCSLTHQPRVSLVCFTAVTADKMYLFGPVCGSYSGRIAQPPSVEDAQSMVGRPFFRLKRKKKKRRKTNSSSSSSSSSSSTPERAPSGLFET